MTKNDKKDEKDKKTKKTRKKKRQERQKRQKDNRPRPKREFNIVTSGQFRTLAMFCHIATELYLYIRWVGSSQKA